MSDIGYLPTDTNTLVQRLQNAEKSIQFIQREHASTLANLHEELAKWQQQCSGIYPIVEFLSLLNLIEMTFRSYFSISNWRWHRNQF